MIACLAPEGLRAEDALIRLARIRPRCAELLAAVEQRFSEKQLAEGTAIAAEGGDFVVALRAASAPVLRVDDLRRGELEKLPGADLWVMSGSFPTGTSHKFHYEVNGGSFGGRNDVAAYLPECYARAGVPQGKLSEKRVHTSQIYGGATSDYWIYVPAQ